VKHPERLEHHSDW